jgi:hypothetical protein
MPMAAQPARGKHDRWILTGFGAVLILAWAFFAFLPLIALRSAYFTLKTPDDVERVRSTLGQLGTYGDMFGALNCLFSGSALIGVIYAVILQRRELHHQQEEIEKSRIDRAAEAVQQRRTALIQATSFLAQAQASRFASLQATDLQALPPEARESLIRQSTELWSELHRNIKILSNFVGVLASEHAEDVNDPDVLLAAFGMVPDKPKEG